MQLIRRIAKMLSTKASPASLSPEQLRALSHKELLDYTLKHLSPITPSQPTDQPPPSSKRISEDAGRQQEKSKKRRKEFDMNRYGQRLVALRLTYQGWRFHGFASQVDSENTVEHHVFAALLKTRLIKSRETCEYSRSGRTDVGVSAMGQVIGLRVRSNLAPPSTGKAELDYVKVINSTLPDGIRVLSWTPVSEGGPVRVYEGDTAPIQTFWNAVNAGSVKSDSDIRRPGEAFSARFDAVHRSYKYFFVRGELDIFAMQRAAQYFEGNHDFRNFCRVDENVSNFERLMYQVQIRSAKDDGSDIVVDPYAVHYIFVKGQAFLWHQVRCMAAVLFEIGMRRERPELVQRMLDDARSNSRSFSNGRPHYRMASPIPLLLFECAYPNTVLSFPEMYDASSREKRTGPTSFERADQKIAVNYSEESAKASILREILRGNDELLTNPKTNPRSDCLPGSIVSSSDEIFSSSRPYRNYLPDTNISKHVPFEERGRDISVEEKKARAVQKNEGKRKQRSDPVEYVT